MEGLDCLNKAMAYIEEHLEDEIDVDKLAKIAMCSAFHFLRMFSYMADMPLSEYIRKRKMSKAAVDMKDNNNKIIDIALKYGYESPTAFNRAFQSIHGVAPSVARKDGIVLKSYPTITFKVTIKGDVEMDYKIKTMDSFKIVGLKQHFSGGIEESFKKVPEIWVKARKNGTISRICSYMDTNPTGVLGVCTSASNKIFDYYIAVATTKPTPEGMDEFIVPKTTWAIFECIGAMPQAIQNLHKRIITEWLPTSGYECANSPDIEVYFDGNTDSSDYKCEVWLPVRKV